MKRCIYFTLFLTVPFFFSGYSIAKEVWINTPSIKRQDDKWSCGPNSATKLLKWNGINVLYHQVRAKTEEQSYLIEYRFGTTPHILRDTIRKFGANAKLQRKANFSDLINLLNKKIPTIVLLRTGTIGEKRFGVPSMHWTVVRGYDDTKREIYIHDTDNGKYKMSFDEFNKQWDFSVGKIHGEVFHKNGIKRRSMIWLEDSRTVKEVYKYYTNSSIPQDWLNLYTKHIKNHGLSVLEDAVVGDHGEKIIRNNYRGLIGREIRPDWLNLYKAHLRNHGFQVLREAIIRDHR